MPVGDRPTVLESSKEAFINIISELNADELHEFGAFARMALDKHHDTLHSHGPEDDEMNDADTETQGGSFQPVSDVKMTRLAHIIKDLRNRVPMTAEAPSEKITIPESKEFADYSITNTVHVDGFLFNEEDVDELCDEGKLSRNYCLDCQSRNVAPLNFISHSASVLQLQFLYQVALANKTKGKVIVDIGSRLGAVLYSGYLFTEAKTLVGVEMNEWFCDLQKNMVDTYKMDDRIEIVRNDIMQEKTLLQSADVVIMNNVFQFFCDQDAQQAIWKFIRTTTMGHKKPMLLVTLPSLQEQIKEAGLPNSLLRGWVKEVKLNYDGGWFEDINDDELEEVKQVHMYKVL